MVITIVVVVVAVVCALVVARISRRDEHAAALGSMSEKWLAENRASRQ